MLHLHFGAGRLGLGLIAPAFQRDGSELYLLNRAVSGVKATGDTALTSERRNLLLAAKHPGRYVIEKPGGSAADRKTVTYDGFVTYDDANLAPQIEELLRGSRGAEAGVIVTASILALENYPPVLETLNLLAAKRARGESIGQIYFIACENTLSAPAIFRDDAVRALLSAETLEHVTCVHALVDRMCVGLEEVATEDGPAVLVRAEDYGLVKLELAPGSEGLAELCAGCDVEFSRHVDTEKQIKSWLLNGTHWLIALDAFEKSRGDQAMKLNEYLLADPRRMAFARTAMREMTEGVAILLRGQDRFRDFVAEVDVGAYLDRAAAAILRRFCATDDPITRILARFRTPTPGSMDTVVSFRQRFADRVDEPMRAWEAVNGVRPPAASRGVLSMRRLVASRTFITAAAA